MGYRNCIFWPSSLSTWLFSLQLWLHSQLFGHLVDAFGKFLLPNYGATIAMFTFIGELLFMFWLLFKGSKIPEMKSENWFFGTGHINNLSIMDNLNPWNAKHIGKNGRYWSSGGRWGSKSKFLTLILHELPALEEIPNPALILNNFSKCIYIY